MTSEKKTAEITPTSAFPDLSAWPTRLGSLLDLPWVPRADQFPSGMQLEETEDAFVLELDVPGVDKKNITIEVSARRVSVHGEREEKVRTGLLRHSTRSRGRFDYEVVLPGAVDDKAATADLEGGVLSITLPKAAGSKSTRVEIN